MTLFEKKYTRKSSQRHLGWGIILWCIFLKTEAQIPRGQFLSDSFKIGKPIQFALSFRHAPDAEIIFPDTTSQHFRPFEVREMAYFPTRTDTRGSLDSAVYTLVSFEAQTIQTLRLPVYWRMAKDCTLVYSTPDSVALQSMILSSGKGLQVQPFSNILPLPIQPNYPLLALWMVGLLGLVGFVRLFFGKQIAQRWQQYQNWRNWRNFSREFMRHQRLAFGQIGHVEKAFSLWIKYMEKTTQTPLSTFTTRELMEVFDQNTLLSESLRQVDAAVYGGVTSPQLNESLIQLHQFAQNTYLTKQ